jgi:hypothetical protein
MTDPDRMSDTETLSQVFYQEGALDLPAMATQRAATSPRMPRP